METCVSCSKELPVVSEDAFFSDEAKSEVPSFGVFFTSSAFRSEVYDDDTQNWYCNYCWWTGWWDI